jgi:subtilisin family serine protease
MRRLPELAVVGAVLALVLGAAGGAAADTAEPTGAAGWQALLGDRPEPQLGGRWIVVLDLQSLADRVRAAGGRASEASLRSWTRIARRAQERAIARLAARGLVILPEQSFVRVINGFSAALDPRALPVLERDPLVEGVYPVRAAYPAAVSGTTALAREAFGPGSGRRPEITLPGSDGDGVTVALLDTGVDLDHPYLEGRLVSGVDIVDPGANADARENPTEPGRPERHGTELAGLLAGSGGPAGLHGVAPGASILPIRVAGWQPDATGGVSVYGRTDQVLAGLEVAVDPNGDGATLDGARIALVGLVEPFASFADGPLARAAAGASVLDTLVIGPAGNDGPAGPGFGSVGAPAGSPDALAVGAADARGTVATVHVLLRAGLEVLASGPQPLGGAVAPAGSVLAPVIAVAGGRSTAVRTDDALGRLFDEDGYSRVAGAAALLPAGPTSPEAVRELAAAGVRAVLVDGIVPAGSLGVDEQVDVPILGLATGVADRLRERLAAGIPVALAVGAASTGANPDLGLSAPFSSTGLALSGGTKPELAAAGVGLATSEPGTEEDGGEQYGTISGSSAAAALAAGAAALLADARPDLDAAGLHGALVAGARRRLGRAGAPLGTVDPQASSSVELVATPPTIAIASLAPDRRSGSGTVTFRNVSRRPLSFRIDAVTAQPGVTVRTSRAALSLAPGASKAVQVTVRAASGLPTPPSALSGTVRAVVRRGGALRVPWTAAVPVAKRPVVSTMRLSAAAFTPNDADPTVLSFVAGRVDGALDRPQLLPLAMLEIELYRGGRRLGTLVTLRDLLPGRYALGLTGRGPGGGRLPAGPYSLRIVGTPIGGGTPTAIDVPFRIR